MTDSTDDAETLSIQSTYCQKHKAGKGLWPHECPECNKQRRNEEMSNVQPKRNITMPKRPAPQSQAAQKETTKEFEVTQGPTRKAWKVGIYGEPGVGKSTLASLCQNAVFADIEGSMLDLDVARVNGLERWEDLRAWVRSRSALVGGVFGIDSMSMAEDWCADYIIRTKADSSGARASTSIEDFKYKTGTRFVADEFRLLLADIEASFKRGASWIMIAHNRVSVFNNPDDKNYIIHAPDLLEAKDVSSRAEWVRFCDHVAYIGKDTMVDRGKAIGGATRTIYMDSSSSRVCKQRGLDVDILPWADKDDDSFWQLVGLNKKQEK